VWIACLSGHISSDTSDKFVRVTVRVRVRVRVRDRGRGRGRERGRVRVRVRVRLRLRVRGWCESHTLAAAPARALRIKPLISMLVKLANPAIKGSPYL
jgi:hypothetical protein